jgi:hypothetical protein
MGSRFVRICAILIMLRSFTNFAKLFQGDDAVLVLFGQILHGGETALPALVVGLFMLVTGIGMLRGAPWALPMIGLYAAFVAVNLVSWTITNPEEFVRVGARLSPEGGPQGQRRAGVVGFLLYGAVALGTTAGPAWVLWKQRRAG